MDQPYLFGQGPVDILKLQNLVLRHQVNQIFGMEAAKNISLIHWVSPSGDMPDDCSYVLIKFLDTDGKTVCACPASYEDGHFWDVYSDSTDTVINPNIILGWSYLPYDDRLPPSL